MNKPKHFTRTIQVYSRSGEYSAAAIAGAIASGRPDYEDETKWSKPAKTRPGNPSGLTLSQHVFPAKCIARFTDAGGTLQVHDLLRGRTRKAKPKDQIFCARRAWDQRSEAGYMRDIEIRFQAAAEAVIAKRCGLVQGPDRRSVDDFFALWYVRSRFNQLRDQETELVGLDGDELTLEQEENLERDHYVFVRSGGFVPTRHLNGIWIQQSVDEFCKRFKPVSTWRVVVSEGGQYIVPDVPTQWIIPLTPDLALIGNVSDSSINQDNLAQLNRDTVAGSRYYYFARQLDQCPCQI